MIRIHFRASFVVVGCVRGRDGGVDARAIRTIHASVSRVVRLGFFEARAGRRDERRGESSETDCA